MSTFYLIGLFYVILCVAAFTFVLLITALWTWHIGFETIRRRYRIGERAEGSTDLQDFRTKFERATADFWRAEEGDGNQTT